MNRDYSEVIFEMVDNGEGQEAIEEINKQLTIAYTEGMELEGAEYGYDGKKKVFQYILSYRDINGRNLLHAAVCSRNLIMIKYLLPHIELLSLCDNSGQTPMDFDDDHTLKCEVLKRIFHKMDYGRQVDEIINLASALPISFFLKNFGEKAEETLKTLKELKNSQFSDYEEGRENYYDEVEDSFWRGISLMINIFKEVR
uniref:Uncharacterized protein n=1 Tax=viral metagenome TaxID=1070528 RepID=A0A6M3JMX0_9ZZZZ